MAAATVTAQEAPASNNSLAGSKKAAEVDPCASVSLSLSLLRALRRWNPACSACNGLRRLRDNYVNCCLAASQSRDFDHLAYGTGVYAQPNVVSRCSVDHREADDDPARISTDWRRDFLGASARTSVSARPSVDSRFPRTPERFPRTPERFPRTPERFPRTPERYPKTPDRFPRTPEMLPRTPERHSLSRDMNFDGLQSLPVPLARKSLS